MSIFHIAASPADIQVGAYDWRTTVGFDQTRVTGSFKMYGGYLFQIDHDVPAGNVMWYHARLYWGNHPTIARLFQVFDANENQIAGVEFSGGGERTKAFGDTTVQTPERQVSNNASYTYDLRVEVSGSTINVKLYVNGALISDVTANNLNGRGKPARLTVYSDDVATSAPHYSEIIIADEDTRGMRLRELRPTSFGIFKQWAGNVQSLRDEDLATGLSTATSDDRVSFGVDNLQHVEDEDIINRVVVQTFAQRGATGLTRMNHFFRFANGTVTDSADIALNTQGTWHREEWVQNPATLSDWTPADLAGIQTGIRART